MSAFEDAAREINEQYWGVGMVPDDIVAQGAAILKRVFGDNDVVTIEARGVWPWFWGLWYVSLLAGLIAYPIGWASLEVARRICAYTLLAYVIGEAAGEVAIRRNSGPENTHTASQLAQRIRMEGKGRSKWYQGYTALAGGLAVLPSVAACFTFWADHPAVGVFIGGVVFAYTYPHFLNRRKHG